MTVKKTVGSLLKQIEAAKVRIGKERDKIDDLISDFQALHDSCDRAFDDLENARDALSELV